MRHTDTILQDANSFNLEQPKNITPIKYAEQHKAVTRAESTSAAMLKHAYDMIEEAELKIKEQEERIRALEDLATTDEMTGLYNRRGLEITFDRELARMGRQNSRGGMMVIIDLDDLKPINDTYGHIAGDKALQLVGETLLSSIRSQDAAARIGGDEFTILLVDIDGDLAAQKAQQIQERLNKLSFDHHGRRIAISASLGFAAYEEGDDFEEVYCNADTALYDNKKERKAVRGNFIRKEGPLFS